jgi:CBS domain-containing protein
VNILFFLTPKSEVAYIYENETLRQTLEKMEHRKFSCIPILSPDGKYTGTISEGDLLWGMKRMEVIDMKESEGIPIMAIPRRSTYKPVHINSAIEDLLDRAINQNFVPVVDDQGFFIGIITRKEIIKYCYKELKKYSAPHQEQPVQQQQLSM